MAMSAIATDGNPNNDNCGQYIPKDVSDFAEINPQYDYEHMSACLPSGTADPRYFEAPRNAPKVMFMANDSKPSPEYESVEDAIFQYQGEYDFMRCQ